MKRRLQIVLHWLAGRRNGVTLSRLVAWFFEPRCGTKAARVIESAEADERLGMLRVKLAGIERPLFYPVEFSRHSLDLVIAEQFNPEDWHYYEVAETRVRQGDIVLDAGAAEGMFALVVAVGCERVVVVEPLGRFVESLGLTFDGVPNVEIVPMALSDEEGEAIISAKEVHSGIEDSGDGDSVRLTTVDRLFEGRRLDYIKADLEGYDVRMMMGARKTIAEHKPRIAITTYHAKEHADEIEQLLRSLEPRYRVRVKGIEEVNGAPVMLHAWVE